MKLSRRTFLGAVAASPVLGHAAVEGAKVQALNGTGLGLASTYLGDEPLVGAGEGNTFYDFASWLSAGGENETRTSADDVRGFDPEILEMHLPLATKVRMQREKNYRRRLLHKKRWFDRILKNRGHVTDFF